ncbi:hypothetical protein H0H87_005533, partial [Tephrocybe sp. NHM501043]
ALVFTSMTIPPKTIAAGRQTKPDAAQRYARTARRLQPRTSLTPKTPVIGAHVDPWSKHVGSRSAVRVIRQRRWNFV